MVNNMTLDINFKGGVKLNAQAVPLQEGYLKLGGVVDHNASTPLAFGVVCSAVASDKDIIKAGVASGAIVRGVSVFDDAIAQNAPAHPNSYLQGMPCAVLNHGFMYLGSWKKDATGAIDPVIGCKVVYKTTTGTIEFVASTVETAPEGYAFMTNAAVRDVDDDNGALIYID